MSKNGSHIAAEILVVDDEEDIRDLVDVGRFRPAHGSEVGDCRIRSEHERRQRAPKRRPHLIAPTERTNGIREPL